MKIKHLQISTDCPPTFVAELSGNHNRELHKAFEIAKTSIEAGAQLVKLQTFTADTITMKSSHDCFQIKDGPWAGRNMYDLYDEAALPLDWHKDIFSFVESLGAICFSAPFDESAVEFLENLNCPAYKVASPEIVDLPLLKVIAETRKPVLISTGMASLAEIENAVDIIKSAGSDFMLLKCTSCYPAKPKTTNLATMVNLKQTFQCEVGLSDHSLGVSVPTAAVALGASLIEKHVKYSPSDRGVDSAFSSSPKEFARMVQSCNDAWHAVGSVMYGPQPDELPCFEGRPSIFMRINVPEGTPIERHHITTVRPNAGITPQFTEQVIGRCVNRDMEAGEPLRWVDLY